MYNPSTRATGDGAFQIGRRGRVADYLDGMSNTIGMTEVKAFQPFLSGGGNPATPGAPPPSSPGAVAGYGGELELEGHTEWVDYEVFETGFTTTFSPNTKVPYSSGGKTYDVDFVSSSEDTAATALTYAAVTSRSYHTNGVNVLLMDGSARFVSNSTPLATWRALGTRAGGEVVNDY